MRASPAHALALQARILALPIDAVQRAGLAVIPLPPETMNADRFMKTDLRHEDPTDTHHANGAFGVLRLQQIADVLQPQVAGPASAWALS